MDQRDKQFAPRLVVIQTGTSVNFPNFDTVRHHVYSFSSAKSFEIKLYTGRPSAPVTFDKPGTATLGCNIHDRMVGWILVVDTPYYAQAPEGGPGEGGAASASSPGRALLQSVPPGNYKLRVWHPRLAPGAAAHEQALVVPSTGNAQAAVKMAGLAP